MIFQDPYNSLDPTYSIGRSVAEPLRIHFGLNRIDRERRATELLERVGLGAFHAQRRPRNLSGGQLQRVSIARALAVEPRLLICDEPVAALDVSIRAEVLNLMRDLRETDGLAYIFITHDLSTVRVIADDLVVMRDGRIVERGPCGAVFDDPRETYTKELLAAVPTVRLRRDDRPVRAPVMK
jgi:peptide/nickel transport system ATP-binding protein/oligopeptide transport system ATP-binding protein